EGRHVAVEIEELHFLLVEADALHGLLRAEALVELRAATQITHLHLRKGAALSRLHQLAAHHQPELALMLQDIARLDVDGIDLHGARLAGAVERTGFGLGALPSSLGAAKEGATARKPCAIPSSPRGRHALCPVRAGWISRACPRRKSGLGLPPICGG